MTAGICSLHSRTNVRPPSENIESKIKIRVEKKRRKLGEYEDESAVLG